MAVLLFWVKAAETPNEVEYRFGPTEDELTRSVVIDKALGTHCSPEGTDDPATSRVVGWVRRRQRQSQEWPDQGVIQS